MYNEDDVLNKFLSMRSCDDLPLSFNVLSTQVDFAASIDSIKGTGLYGRNWDTHRTFVASGSFQNN